MPQLRSGKPQPLTTADTYNLIKLALTLVAGIGGVVALVVAYRRQEFAEQAHAREDTLMFTDRFREGSRPDRL
jgi:hypothetical protein